MCTLGDFRISATAALLLTLLSSIAVAQESGESITAAFGITLGGELDPTIVTSERKYASGKESYQVRPPKPFRSFTSYSISITPLTKRIHSIFAFRFFERRNPCQDELTSILVLLKDKYGEPDSSSLGKYLFRRPPGTVYVSCSITRNAQFALSIGYFHDELVAKSKVEEREKRGDAAKESGL